MPDKPLFGSEYHGTDAWTFAFVLACIPTEFVLSFTLDTLALPYTVYRSHKNPSRPANHTFPAVATCLARTRVGRRWHVGSGITLVV